MNYGTLETELVTRLNAYFVTNEVEDKFEAVEIPENQAQQSRPFTKGKVTVQYLKSAYQGVQGMGAVSQHETLTIRCLFETRDLRSDVGYYALVERVKRSLLGYTPAHCTKKLYMDTNDLLDFENNTVAPYLDFKTETLNVEMGVDTEDPLFKDLTIESQCPT